ncbi:MAG: hypothetical protein H6Q73_1297 [Firmicutes bacterium]|nr:hypothetical protein [Bacillota bacterium]
MEEQNKVCRVCHYDLTGYVGRVRTIYKYCPLCGANNNPGMKTVKCGPLNKWTKELFFIGLFVIVMVFGPESTLFVKAIFASLVFVMYLIVSLIMYIKNKRCSWCLIELCERSHKFCYNCGKKFD